MRPRACCFGAGGHASAVVDIITQSDKFGGYDIDIYEIDRSKVGKHLLGIPISSEPDLLTGPDNNSFAIVTVGCVGDCCKRVDLFQKLENSGWRFLVLVASSAYVSPSATIGDGAVVLPQSVVGCGALIGRNCIINSGAIVEHGVILGDHSHISTGVILNGNARVGKGVFIGSGSVVFQGAEIPDGSIVPAGSVIR